MWEAVSKNWGYLMTIVTILAVGFGAGIWMKESMETLNTLPDKVTELAERMGTLEGLEDDIKESRCMLLAQTEIAKNDVKIYAVNLAIATVNEKSNDLLAKEELTRQEVRKLEALGRHQRALNKDKREFEDQRSKQHTRLSTECQ